MIDRDANSIIYNANLKLGELAYQLAEGADEGLEGDKSQKVLWTQAIQLYSLLDVLGDNIVVSNNSIYQLRGITEKEFNKILYKLKDVAKLYDLPVAPFIPVKDVSIVIYGNVPGPPGAAGTNAYVAIAYAQDNTGTGISTTPDPTRPYFAIKQSTIPITLDPSNFTGLWQLINVTIPSFTLFQNLDVDIGTEVCDSFDATLAKGVDWDYVISKGSNIRKGRLSVEWVGATIQVSEENTFSIGTVDVSLDADINSGLIRLLATAISNDWIVSGNRTLIK